MTREPGSPDPGETPACPVRPLTAPTAPPLCSYTAQHPASRPAAENVESALVTCLGGRRGQSERIGEVVMDRVEVNRMPTALKGASQRLLVGGGTAWGDAPGHLPSCSPLPLHHPQAPRVSQRVPLPRGAGQPCAGPCATFGLLGRGRHWPHTVQVGTPPQPQPFSQHPRLEDALFIRLHDSSCPETPGTCQAPHHSEAAGGEHRTRWNVRAG